MHLANSNLWTAAYHDLEALTPGRVITLAILDFFLSWESHQSQRHVNSVNSFYYLCTKTLKELNGDLDHDKSLLEKILGPRKQPIDCAPVIFLVSQGQNTYFLTLFDFSEKKTLVLGRYSHGQMDFGSAHAGWETWNGPTLWRRIGKAFDWLKSDMTEGQPMVDVYDENWIIVCHCIKLL
jgi:hypothetical protein